MVAEVTTCSVMGTALYNVDGVLCCVPGTNITANANYASIIKNFKRFKIKKKQTNFFLNFKKIGIRSPKNGSTVCSLEWLRHTEILFDMAFSL